MAALPTVTPPAIEMSAGPQTMLFLEGQIQQPPEGSERPHVALVELTVTSPGPATKQTKVLIRHEPTNTVIGALLLQVRTKLPAQVAARAALEHWVRQRANALTTAVDTLAAPYGERMRKHRTIWERCPVDGLLAEGLTNRRGPSTVRLADLDSTAQGNEGIQSVVWPYIGHIMLYIFDVDLDAPKLRPRRPPQLGERHAQQTFPEAKAFAQAITAGPSGRGWIDVDGEPALAHKAALDSPLSIRFISGPLSQWMGRPQTAETLRDTLARMGVPAVILFHICVGELLDRSEVTVSVDQLIAAVGWQPRSAAQRQEMRARIWEWLVTFEAWQIIGRRPGIYPDPKTKQARDLTTVDALLRITGRAYADETQLVRNSSAPPDEVTFVAGPWLSRWRHNRQVLTYFGNVQQIGRIPGGKPSGAWAQAIGLALQQRWRELAAKRAKPAHVGEDKHLIVRFDYAFTRRELLSMFPPSPTVEEILNGPNPKRAVTYWSGAVTLLKEQHIIGHYSEPKKRPAKRQDWAAPWLDEPLDIRPIGEAVVAIVAIADRARARRRSGGTRTAEGAGVARKTVGVARKTVGVARKTVGV